MAGRSRRHNHSFFFSGDGGGGATAADEFDESDIWGFDADSSPPHNATAAPAPAAEFRKMTARPFSGAAAAARKKVVVVGGGGGMATSLPVNIPDWEKILKSEYHGHDAGDWAEEDDCGFGSGGAMVPPHVFLCRNRAASMSVHEGVGRTLKGRDLSRVRNAIWEKTGFQD